MNKEQGRAERDYRLAKAVFTMLRDKGIITDFRSKTGKRPKCNGQTAHARKV